MTRTLARELLAVELLDECEDGVGGGCVEVPGRFVRKQEFGLGDERAGERDALLLAAGEFAGAVVGAVRQADVVEPLCGGGKRLFVRDATGEERHGDVFERRELRQKVVELPDVADVTVAISGGLFGGQAGDVGVGAPDFAGRGTVERRQEVEQGAFARAGFSHDGDHFAGGDRRA